MTTPQNQLYNIADSIKRIEHLLKGGYPGDDEVPEDIYDMCKSIELEVTEFNERMDLIEDKLNLIIKLLGKPNET